MKRPLRCAGRLVLLLLAGTACSARRGAHLEALPDTAVAALAEARTLMRARAEGWLERAEGAALRAAAAAPQWVAPARVLDDLARERLTGHTALAERRAALERASDAGTLYLAGRLEGRAGRARLEQAARLAPELSWAQHGLAWNLFLDGDARAALASGRRALELARSSYELGTFAVAEARYLLALERLPAAGERLVRHLADARLAEPERTELEFWLARVELQSEEAEIRARGFWRGVALLERDTLGADELETLGELLLQRRGASGQGDVLAVLLDALGRAPGAGRERLRARLLVERGAHVLAAALLERDGWPAGARYLRARALELGQSERALTAWLATLPAFLRDEQGLPREPALRALCLAARDTATPSGAQHFGECLLAAGWFEEAESWASALSSFDPAAALQLAARAASAQALLAGIHGLLSDIDEERASLLRGASGASPEPARQISDLDALLAAMEPLFERQRGAPLDAPLSASPRLAFGAFAAVVHPGPRFSALDQAEGRGQAGAEVPGLAQEFARLGRFGLFGQAPGGGGPDGTVLRVVGGEWRAGEHLGVPFAGWVAWCQGADIESRPGRAGSSVSGAALHEGYWIDLAGVRADWERGRALERARLEGDPHGVELALLGRGPRLGAENAAEERARWLAPLGEGERVLLAVLRERPAPAPGAARVSFEELVELTALHEEGHLTDRTRFLPLTRHWAKAFGLLLRHGFSARGVARALEYRAQLVALCTAREPRLVLAETLAAAEGEGGPLAHGEAYRELVGDFLRVAADQLDSLPALERDRYVLYQLHCLGGEEVRRLALRLAQEHGMPAD